MTNHFLSAADLSRQEVEQKWRDHRAARLSSLARGDSFHETDEDEPMDDNNNDNNDTTTGAKGDATGATESASGVSSSTTTILPLPTTDTIGGGDDTSRHWGSGLGLPQPPAQPPLPPSSFQPPPSI